MKKVQGFPKPLGVTIGQSSVNFAVSAPEKVPCELLLYCVGEVAPERTFELKAEDGIGDVRFLGISDIVAEKYEYNYRIDGHIQIDPFVKALSGCGPFGARQTSGRAQVRGRLALPCYDWEEDAPLQLPYHEVIAYSLHVRGFTKHSSAHVKHNGTFHGVIEKLPYLKALGINQIQCMPIYEFEENIGERTNYWGYGTGYFFAPKLSYAASGDAATECRDMIKECHKQGVEVVFEMPFVEGILPQTVLECLQYYLLEYHVDGFILNPYHVPLQMLQSDPLLRKTKLMQKDDEFQNVMRRFLKSDEGMVNDVMRVQRYNSKERGTFNYITSHTGFTLLDVVSYDGKHNDQNGERNQDGPEYNYSWNCGAEGLTRKRTIVLLRKRQLKNAFFLLLMSQGTPCILSGDEFENTQKGNNNVYCQDNELAWLDWGKLKRDDALYQYVKELIQLRKRHPVLHRAAGLLGMDQTACGLPDVSYHGEYAWRMSDEISSRQIGVMYSGEDLKDTDCFVAYNMHWLKHTFALPALGKRKKWYQVIDTSKESQGEPKLLENQRTMELQERSIVLLIGK